MKISAIFKYAAMLGGLALLLFSIEAHAQAANNGDLLDKLMTSYTEPSALWIEALKLHAIKIFVALSTFSMVFTFGFMAMRQADFGELFSELIRYVLFTAFFLWMLTNGSEFTYNIFDSFGQIGGEVTNAGAALRPTDIVKIGFDVFAETTTLVPDDAADADKLMPFFMGMIILISLALIAINIVLLNVSIWVLAYGGVFLLGFGSARWTSDIAIGYYKSVLAVAISWLSLIIILFIGLPFLEDIKSGMGPSANLQQLSFMLVAALALLVLTNKIPAMLASIVSGARVGGAMNITGMVSATVVSGGAAMSAGMASAASNTHKIVEMFGAARDDVARARMETANSTATTAFGMGASAGMYSHNGDFFKGDQPSADGSGLASAMGPTIYASSSIPAMSAANIATAQGAAQIGQPENATANAPSAPINKSEQSVQTAKQEVPGSDSTGKSEDTNTAQGANKDAATAANLADAGMSQQSGSGMVNVVQPAVQGAQSSSQTTQHSGAATGSASAAVSAGGNTQQSGSGMVNVVQPAVQGAQSSSQTTQHSGAATGSASAAVSSGGNTQQSGGGMVNVTQAGIQATQTAQLSSPFSSSSGNMASSNQSNSNSNSNGSSNSNNSNTRGSTSSSKPQTTNTYKATGSTTSLAGNSGGTAATPSGSSSISSTSTAPISKEKIQERTKTLLLEKKSNHSHKKSTLIDKLLGQDDDEASDTDIEDEVASFREGKKE